MSWLTVISLVMVTYKSVGGQYQLVREDPFAALSATLVTKQAAACDGEFAHLRCPIGAKVTNQLVRC